MAPLHRQGRAPTRCTCGRATASARRSAPTTARSTWASRPRASRHHERHCQHGRCPGHRTPAAVAAEQHLRDDPRRGRGARRRRRRCRSSCACRITRGRRPGDYESFFARITATANFFHSLGVGKDDVVAFVLPNLPETHLTIWGGEAAGIVFAINPLLEPAAIGELLGPARPRCWSRSRRSWWTCGRSCSRSGQVPSLSISSSSTSRTTLRAARQSGRRPTGHEVLPDRCARLRRGHPLASPRTAWSAAA